VTEGRHCQSYTEYLRPVSFTDARNVVLRELRACPRTPAIEIVGLEFASGRVLAKDITADRDYPPFNRSMRDGFAVRSSDIPGTLRIVGEVRAGSVFTAAVRPGETVEIMTGAPVPAGPDTVVMVEHCIQNGDGTVTMERPLEYGMNVALQGSEAPKGGVVAPGGQRIDYGTVSLLAASGHISVPVFRKPRVAILSTGDEIVPIDQAPQPHQIRNSNAWSLAAQVTRAGGESIVLPIAPDTLDETRQLIEQGLQADLLLLSGGVSAGKYDVVEPALARLRAAFSFDRVLIQPGQPLVFGRVDQTFFFGLPGNPGATIVTFEIFARAAVDLLGGMTETTLPLAMAKLTKPFRHKPGLTRFLPATLREGAITPVPWQGSGDIPALARANCFLVADPQKPDYEEGEWIPVLMK
jgi:molybdopterin molybdotransferase